MSIFTRPLANSFRRKLIAIATIFFVTVLLVPVPVAAALIRSTDQTVRDGGHQIRTWLLSVFGTTSDGGNRERKGVRPLTAPTKAEREARVARLELNVAPEIELKSRQRSQLSAIPVDAKGDAVVQAWRHRAVGGRAGGDVDVAVDDHVITRSPCPGEGA